MTVVQIDDDGGTAAPIDMLEAWFEAHGWSNERVGDEEIVASTQGAWGSYELRGVWRDDDNVLQFLGFPDITVSAHQTATVYETIGLVNEQLWLGHFELWATPGTVLTAFSTHTGISPATGQPGAVRVMSILTLRSSSISTV